MNDDSAEWMAQLKASGQLRPANEGERGDGDEARMGVVTNTNDEGRQVLGTCSPERLAPILADYRKTIEKAWSAATAHPDYAGADGSPVGQCGVTSAWLQRRLLNDHGKYTLYCDGTVYLGSEWHPVHHVWLTNLDGSIYDLTADQFEYPVMAYVAERTLSWTEVKRDPVRARLALLEALS